MGCVLAGVTASDKGRSAPALLRQLLASEWKDGLKFVCSCLCEQTTGIWTQHVLQIRL